VDRLRGKKKNQQNQWVLFYYFYQKEMSQADVASATPCPVVAQGAPKMRS